MNKNCMLFPTVVMLQGLNGNVTAYSDHMFTSIVCSTEICC